MHRSGDKREKWLAFSPFSSRRNVRRGRALGGDRKAERNKGKAENGSMQFVKCGQARKEDINAKLTKREG